VNRSVETGLPREFLELVEAQLQRLHPPLCPEITTCEAPQQFVPVWEAVDEIRGNDVPPYWAWSWPGSQALARYLLDNPDTVRGRTVLDLGAGNGLASVAAALAGASKVTANDIDPWAGHMTATHAKLNGVFVEFDGRDLLDDVTSGVTFDVVLVGDLFYTRDLARQAEHWLDAARRAGCEVLLGEPGRAFALEDGVHELACYDVAVSAELENRTSVRARVLRLGLGRPGRDGARSLD